MAATYTIHDRLIRVELTGDTPPRELVRCVQAALSDPDCPQEADLLIDATASTSLAGRSPGEVRYAAHSLSRHASRLGGRCAIVVSSDAEYEVVRLGNAYASSIGTETRGFLSEAAARRWLEDGDGER